MDTAILTQAIEDGGGWPIVGAVTRPPKSSAPDTKREGLGAMLFVVVALLFAPLGCAGTGSLLPVITAAAQGAQALGSLLGVAEAGSSAYLARHPSVETQAKVSGALGKARKALAKLDQAIAIGKEVERYRSAALEAYAELRELLASLGILDAKAPDGGAESVLAPMPKPFSLPLVEDVEALF